MRPLLGRDGRFAADSRAAGPHCRRGRGEQPLVLRRDRNEGDGRELDRAVARTIARASACVQLGRMLAMSRSAKARQAMGYSRRGRAF